MAMERAASASTRDTFLISLCKYSPEFWPNLGLKAALTCLLAFGAFSGLQQFDGKSFVSRLDTYPFAALVIPSSGRCGAVVPPTPIWPTYC